MNQDIAFFIAEHDYEKLTGLMRSFGSTAAAALEEKIGAAHLLPAEKVPKDLVTMNSCVRFIDLETQKENEIRLVYPTEADLEEKKISVFAPIGVALLGLHVGQTVDWALPNGARRRIQVVGVRE